MLDPSNSDENSTIGRLNIAFTNAREARDLVVSLSDDSRLASSEFVEVQAKLKAIREAVDIVLSNA